MFAALRRDLGKAEEVLLLMSTWSLLCLHCEGQEDTDLTSTHLGWGWDWMTFKGPFQNSMILHPD